MTIPHAEQGDVVEGRSMGSALVVPQIKLTLFVRRASQQWVVLDPEGNFWVLPSVENPWDQRQPFFPTEEDELEPVPGHYKYMLGLPF
ncbi:MAG TPA: hypothetical protein VK395_26665 [Gemmataceae bacterium]|nr:hypothetical protein [Gemmataceae bacterium]